MTNSKLRDVLDLTGFPIERIDVDNDEEGYLYRTVLMHNEDFRKDIFVIFQPIENLFKVYTLAPDYIIPSDKISDALLFCNAWMKHNLFARARVNIDDSRFEILSDLPYVDMLPDDYLVDWVKLVIAAGRAFYEDVGKEI